ncbi:MAG: thiol-disulfide isomerase/thioredoxin [Planctomycetota bacterium]
MVASSAAEAEGGIGSFQKQDVGSSAYLARHNGQMFKEGRSFSGNERDKLFLNRGDGTFADLSNMSGADSANDGRAVLATDFDDDGDVDLFVHNIQRERHGLFRNNLNRDYGEFVKVRLRATTSQYEAVGAQVTVTGQHGPVTQILSRGAGFVSCQAPELVYGIGLADKAPIEVRWPNGVVESFGSVSKNSRVLLVEGAGEAASYKAQPRPLPDPLPAGMRVSVGDRVPVFAMLDADENEVLIDVVKLAEGKPLYLNFWASTCVACVVELPDLQEIEEAGEIKVIGLSMDAPADMHRAAKLFAKRGADFPGYFIGAPKVEGRASLAEIVDLERLPIPTTLVLSPDGVIEKIIRGPIAGY